MSTQGPDPLRDLAAEPELARLLHLLGAAPTERELAGQNGAIRAFRTIRNTSSPARRGRRRAVFSSLVSAKFGATIAGVAIGLTGVATAAVLPTTMSAGPARSTVTVAPASPAAAAAPTPTSTAAPPSAALVGPDASGPAAKGLCTAWRTHVAQVGEKPATWQDAVPFTNLVAAAGGPAEVETFCAEVEGQAPRLPKADRAPKSTGKPAARPPVTPGAVPRGKSTTVPVGPPSGLPPIAKRPTGTPAPPTTRPTPPTPPVQPTSRP
jgi:hypothetical protein